jgi:hypothetical protein
MKTRTRQISKYLYVVELKKHGVWIDCSNPMPLCDAKALKERIKEWESQ